tara:strand:- start:2467 stop:3372 length:906 start_codon:yes stop_codon:yes gene_type:complete
MKRNLLLLINIILVTQCFSQLYVKIKPSYNKSLGGQVLTRIGSIEYTPGLTEITEKIENVNGSLGQGYMGNLSFGYSFTRQFSMELGVSYLKGEETQSSYSVRNSNSVETSTYSLTGDLLSFEPAFVFSSKEKDSFRTYVSLGFPISNVSYNTYFVGRGGNSGKTEEIEERFIGSINVGVSTKIGISRRLNKSLELFGEIGFTYINFSPNESEIVIYNVSGNDLLSTLSTSELKSTYKKSVVTDYNYENGQWVESYSENKARIRQKFNTPFSYLSFSCGIKFYLFDKEYNGRELNKNDYAL